MTSGPITIETELARTRGRFVATRDGSVVGEMTFSRAGEDAIIVDHTDVSGEARGGGVGRALFEAMVAWARAQEVGVIPLCPYAAAMFRRIKQTHDVLRGRPQRE